MSKSVDLLSNNLQKLVDQVFQGEDTPNPRQAKIFSNHLDKIIRLGFDAEITNKETGEKEIKHLDPSATEVISGLSSIAQNNSLLANTLTEIADQKRELWLTGAEQKLPEALLKHAGALKEVCKDLNSVAANLEAKSPNAKEEALTDEQRIEVKNVFFKKLQVIAKDINDLSGDEKAQAFKSALSEASQELGASYGPEALRELSSQIKDSSALAYTYGVSAKTGLPSISNEAELETLSTMIDDFKAGDFKAISETQKDGVLDFITEVAENGGKIEGKIDLEVKAIKLSKPEKAYYQFLKQGADEIKQVADNPADLIGALAKNLPDLLMPAIIGAVVGYLMGGMEVVGGIGAIAVSILGARADAAETQESDGRVTPPEFASSKAA